MQPTTAKLERAKAAHSGTKRYLFSNIPPLDLLDRVSMVTVAAGVRRIGVLEGDGVQVGQIRDALGNRGIVTSTSNAVWTIRHLETTSDDRLSLLHSMRSEEPKRQSVLWLFDDADARREVKGKQISKALAGHLLGYPPCCVQANEQSGLDLDIRFLDALTAKVGSDLNAIRQALMDDVGVDMDESGAGVENVAATTAKFPFVSHVCCDSCLVDIDSPSSRLNAQFDALTKEVAPDLHEAVLTMTALVSQLDSTDNPSRIFDEADRIHRKLLPDVPLSR